MPGYVLVARLAMMNKTDALSPALMDFIPGGGRQSIKVQLKNWDPYSKGKETGIL